MRHHGERQAVCGCAHPIDGPLRDPLDRSRLFPHFCRIDEKHDVRGKRAQLTGPVFGGKTGFDDQDPVGVGCPCALCQGTCHQDSGRIIRTQRIPNTKDGDPWQ